MRTALLSKPANADRRVPGGLRLHRRGLRRLDAARAVSRDVLVEPLTTDQSMVVGIK